MELPKLQKLGQRKTIGAALIDVSSVWSAWLLPLAAAFAVGAVLTLLSIQLMTWLGRVDQPAQSADDRRMHQQATPRGGLLGIAALALAYAFIVRPAGVFWIAPAMALVGLLDDLSPQPALVRLALQAAIAVAAVTSLGDPWPDGPVLAIRATLVFGVVWIVNASNFFDGANGLLSGLAIWFFIGLGALGMTDAHVVWVIGLLAGFFVWNFPNARVFMGDVGSYLIGGLFAWVFLQAAQISVAAILVVVCGLAPMLFDTTYTLLARLAHGERIWQAHREHTYQYLMRSGVSAAKLLMLFLLHGAMSLSIAYFIQQMPHSPFQRQQIAVFLGWAALSLVIWLAARRYARQHIASQAAGVHSP